MKYKKAKKCISCRQEIFNKQMSSKYCKDCETTRFIIIRRLYSLINCLRKRYLDYTIKIRIDIKKNETQIEG